MVTLGQTTAAKCGINKEREREREIKREREREGIEP